MKTIRVLIIGIIGFFSIMTVYKALEGSLKKNQKPLLINKTEEKKYRKAVFAGGCFWCMQPPFDALEGVIQTMVGYTGGDTHNPSYQSVLTGKTGHAEAIQVIYDPKKVSYLKLLDVFWKNIDPTAKNRQFADIGTQYRTAIFYQNEEEKKLALESKKKLEASGKFKNPIVTEITKASTFFLAEDYHDKYYKKNPIQYKQYKIGSGREGYLKQKWKRDQ